MGDRFLADLTNKLPRSLVRVMFVEAEKLKRSGKDLIRLEIDEPDFDTAQNIKLGRWTVGDNGVLP